MVSEQLCLFYYDLKEQNLYFYTQTQTYFRKSYIICRETSFTTLYRLYSQRILANVIDTIPVMHYWIVVGVERSTTTYFSGRVFTPRFSSEALTPLGPHLQLPSSRPDGMRRQYTPVTWHYLVF